jgi:hypothetical protein
MPADVRHTLQVNLTCAQVIHQFERAQLKKLYISGVPSERFIISALQPTLRVANNNLLRNISGCIEQSWEVYDNAVLYGKLLYWAMVLDCYQFIHTIPQAAAFAAGDDPVWINLDAPDPLAADYIQTITSKTIVLIQEMDFEMADLQAIYWLAKSGIRLDPPVVPAPPAEPPNVMHNTYVSSPGVGITILAHGPQLLTPKLLLAYAEKLASRRGD